MTQDQVNQLIKAIKYGSVVGASDGSLLPMQRTQFDEYTPPTVGSYRFIIQDEYNNNTYIRGCHVSPNSNTLSTLTTVSFGCIALLTTIHLLCAQGRLDEYDEDMNTILVGLDNQEVYDRTMMDPPEMNTSDHLRPEWDLWKIMRMLLRVIPVKVCRGQTR